jgi:hypothetical protein
VDIGTVLGIIVGAVAIVGSIIGSFYSMIAPLRTEVSQVKGEVERLEIRARTELDKAERGLKELTTRAETVVRQTVEDVDRKLQREAELIEEKAKIQFADIARQLDLLRAEINVLRRNGRDGKGTTSSST